jgi:hypothetical protein
VELVRQPSALDPLGNGEVRLFDVWVVQLLGHDNDSSPAVWQELYRPNANEDLLLIIR